MATKGRLNPVNNLDNCSTSTCIKKPNALSLIFCAIPTVDACALCAVANASLINTSPSEAQNLASSTLFFDSALSFKSSNLVFSNTKISPFFKFLAAFWTSAPLVDFIKITLLLGKSSASFCATKFNDLSFLSSSVLTLPKCESRIIEAFLSNIYLIVGKAASILFISIILPLLIGTLKSTLRMTFLLFSSKSLIVFFI